MGAAACIHCTCLQVSVRVALPPLPWCLHGCSVHPATHFPCVSPGRHPGHCCSYLVLLSWYVRCLVLLSWYCHPQATIRIEPLSVEVGGEAPLLRGAVGVLATALAGGGGGQRGGSGGGLKLGGSFRADLSPLQATLGSDGSLVAQRLDIRIGGCWAGWWLLGRGLVGGCRRGLPARGVACAPQWCGPGCRVVCSRVLARPRGGPSYSCSHPSPLHLPLCTPVCLPLVQACRAGRRCISRPGAAPASSPQSRWMRRCAFQVRGEWQSC